MKEFKFFQKEIRRFDVYEEMVLGIIDYCRNNAIVPYGYSHPFTITTSEGLQHKRIVIKNVTKLNQFPLRVYIHIEYDLHLIQDNEEDIITNHILTIDEEEYYRLTERNQL
jgi:hypothetical protein